MTRRGLVLLAGLVLCACPKAAPKPDVEPPKVLEPVDAVRELLAEAYRAVEAGDADRLSVLLTIDALVFGLGPSDTWAGGETISTKARQALLPVGLSGDAIKVEDSRVVVGLAEGEQSAWLFDAPKVVTTHLEKDQTWLPRVTGHAVREGDAWRLDALHVSLAVPDQVLSAPDASKQLLPPVDVPNERSADADQLVGLVKRSLDDYAVKLDRTSERPEFVQLGTSPTEVFLGGVFFKELIKPQLGAIKKAGFTWKLDGNLRVKVAPGGKSGWAAGVIVQRMGTGKRAQVYPPFRVLWTAVEEGGVWNLSSEHQSLAVREELREGATPETLKTWQAVRENAEKTMAKTKGARKPGKSGKGDKPQQGSDIGAW